MTENINSGGVRRLEKEVAEIKQTTKETNQTVNELSQQVIKIETILTEQNKFNLAQIKHLEDDSAELWQTVKGHDNRITSIENNGLPARIKKSRRILPLDNFIDYGSSSHRVAQFNFTVDYLNG